MKYFLLPLPILFLAGCGSLTRAEYEHANGLPVMAECKHDNGDVQVVYGPDRNPGIDPVSGEYSCPEGVRVAIYRDGTLVKRWFQESEVTK